MSLQCLLLQKHMSIYLHVDIHTVISSLYYFIVLTFLNDHYTQVIFSVNCTSQNFYNKLFGIKGSFESNRVENQWTGQSQISLSS